MGLCDSSANILLIVINAITVIVGLAVTIIAVLGLLQQQDVKEITGGPDLTYICIGVLVVGVIILCVGLIGWYAGFKGNATLAKGYVLLIILIVCLQLSFALFGYFKRKPLKVTVDSYLNQTFNATSFDSLTKGNQDFVNFVQENLKCCGLNGTWEGDLPASCCSNTTNTTLAEPCTTDTAYADGCIVQAENFVSNHVMIIVVVLAIGFFLELICMAAGCYIAKEVQGYKRV